MKAILDSRIALVFLFILISCSSVNKEAETYEGFPLEVTADYKKAWVEEFSNDLGTFYVYELRKPMVIQSYPIKGRFYVNAEGKLHHFTLAEDHVINGTLIPEGSVYEQDLDEGDGSYMIDLSKSITIQGFPVYHKETRLFRENNVGFFNDGVLSGFHLGEDMIINGIPCNGSKKNRGVTLYRNRNIRFCYLSEDMDIEGIPSQGGEENNELFLNPDGQILSCVLSEDFSIDGELYTQGTQIIFDTDNKVHYLSGKLKFLSFHDNGSILNVVLKNDIEIKGMQIKKNSRLIFNENGSLVHLRTGSNMEIDGLKFSKGTWLDFDENGNLL
jgi:hypothetical protein